MKNKIWFVVFLIFGITNVGFVQKKNINGDLYDLSKIPVKDKAI